jgi:hypothetical protein
VRGVDNVPHILVVYKGSLCFTFIKAALVFTLLGCGRRLGPDASCPWEPLCLGVGLTHNLTSELFGLLWVRVQGLYIPYELSASVW